MEILVSNQFIRHAIRHGRSPYFCTTTMRNVSVVGDILLRSIVFLLLIVGLCSMLSNRSLADTAGDRASIAKAMMATWDRPEERLSVEPVTVGVEYALAGWTQGDRGGRALLKRGHGGWSVHVCGGDHLLDAQLLRKIGVTDSESKTLIADQNAAESKLPARKVAMFSLFDSIVEMGIDGHHAPSVDHGQHKKGHH